MDPNLEALDQVRITAIDLAIQSGPKLLVAPIIMGVGLVAPRRDVRLVGRALAGAGAA